MDILIVRHGQAVEEAPGLGDGGRWLTAKGRKVTRRVAAWLAKRKDRRPAAIWTSPLVRAVQTAEILAEAMGLEEDVSVVAELSPEHAPSELIRLLSLYRGPEPLALVGHEPLLSMLGAELLGDAAWGGAGGEARSRLKKSGVLSLRWEGRGAASLRFLLDPKQMSVLTGSRPAGPAEDPGGSG